MFKIISDNFKYNCLYEIKGYIDDNELIYIETESNLLKIQTYDDFYKLLKNKLNIAKETNEFVDDINAKKIKYLYEESIKYLNYIDTTFNYEELKKVFPNTTEEKYNTYVSMIKNEIVVINENYNNILKLLKEINENLNQNIDIDSLNKLESSPLNTNNWNNEFQISNYEDDNKEILDEWNIFLESLLKKSSSNFIINQNNVTNFDIIFRNPETKLDNSAQKEPIVHLSYNSSRRSEPVFSIGNTTFNSKAFGPKLTSGNLVVAAYRNVPLSTLHAISNSTSYSVEDLPPLDLYIVPKTIIDDGRFEVLVIKGINFINTQQNNNASSTGIYHSFQFFAKSVEPTNYSSLQTLLSL